MSETLTDPLLGRVVDGRYEILEHVATGGMATVYLAFDRRLEREVALKAMHQPLVEDDMSREFVARFRREAKSSARLTHPGIVHVYDQGIDGEISYLTMEYVRGENLRSRIAHDGTLAVGEALALADAVLDALAAAHRLGLVHRDVKPENVLIDTDGRARITDFGLARAVTEVGTRSDTVIMGSPGYLAPELLSMGSAGPSIDVYAVGVMLFEMVTGRHPFTGESSVEIASKHVHEDIPAPSTFAPWLPTEFDDLVGSLASRDPADRPADAAAALVLVRSTRALMDDPTLDRRADPPSGAFAIMRDPDATMVFDTPAAGATVALPVGIGRPFAATGVIEAELIDEDPEARLPQPTQRRAVWWVGAVLAVLIVLGGATLWWYNAIGPGAYTTIPPVVEKTQAQAKAVLESAGFTVKLDQANHDDVPEGWAIGTDPKAQTRVLKNSEVTLIVSLGPLMVDVPSVIGKQQDEAKRILEDEGFTLGEPELVYRDLVPKGEVIASDPEPGETVRHDVIVTLTISDGPEPITFPKVVGETEEDAEKILDEFALKVTIERERTEDAPKGVVFKQDPAAGDDGFRTGEITIWVSDGPPLVKVPDVRGLDFKEARKVLRQAGFKVDGDDQYWNFSTVVFSQSPAPDTEAEKGSVVIVSY